MEDSILNSVKKVLGISPADTAFDEDVLMHVNSAFSTLHQLGLGPDEGFFITDAEPKWDDFIEDRPHIQSVKTYVCLKVRIVFDPPTSSFVMNALQEQIKEHEVRLNIERERTEWNDPDPTNPDLPEDIFGSPVVIDGGDA